MISKTPKGKLERSRARYFSSRVQHKTRYCVELGVMYCKIEWITYALLHTIYCLYWGTQPCVAVKLFCEVENWSNLICADEYTQIQRVLFCNSVVILSGPLEMYCEISLNFVHNNAIITSQYWLCTVFRIRCAHAFVESCVFVVYYHFFVDPYDLITHICQLS